MIFSPEGLPFAAMYLGIPDGDATIWELIVVSELRGRGFGTAILRELIERSSELLKLDALNYEYRFKR